MEISDLTATLAAAKAEIEALTQRVARAERRAEKAESAAIDENVKSRIALDEATADGDRLFNELQRRIALDVAREPVAAANGCLALLGPILADRISVDRKTLAATPKDEAGRPYVSLRGDAGTIADIIDELRKDDRFARAFKTVEPKKDVPDKPNLTEQMAAIRAQRTAHPQMPEVRGNPFMKSQWNLTAQGLITRADPTRAAQLRAAAEGSAH